MKLKSNIFYLFVFIITIPLIGCKSAKKLSNENNASPQVKFKKIENFKGDTLSVSPSHKYLFISSKQNKDNQLWLFSNSADGYLKISEFDKNDAISNISWSSDEKYTAFETYNIDGHSPLTTSHVWVYKVGETGLHKILQPSPNERFSTLDPVWKSNDSLIVTGASIDGNPIKYIYNAAAGKIVKLNSEEKK